MKANVKLTSRKVEIIDDIEQVAAAECGELTVEGKPVLVVKGANTEAVCFQIYYRFSKELDSEGQAFVFSRKYRSLAHTDPVWHSRSKVTGPQFEAYLASYFQFAEKVTSVNGEALILTDKLPTFFSALMMQGRFSGKFVDLFEIVN
jgi:hypothetical protein